MIISLDICLLIAEFHDWINLIGGEQTWSLIPKHRSRLRIYNLSATQIKKITHSGVELV